MLGFVLIFWGLLILLVPSLTIPIALIEVIDMSNKCSSIIIVEILVTLIPYPACMTLKTACSI